MSAQAVKRAVPGRGFTLAPYDYATARRIAAELELSEPVAATLVRRGYTTVEDARAFLDADERHDPNLFKDMDVVAERLRSAVERGERITIHGDYDADGVCATAILVEALRALGADCGWYIPSRLEDGYGLSPAGIEQLAARDTRLLVTADCGIACPEEVGLARDRGMDVIVTDHHQPGQVLPDCPIVHPEVSGYPCPDLCAAGVAYKVAQALRGEGADGALDLAALATVADLVPLTGENRALVRRGLELARRGGRPGIAALAGAARIELERLDEGDLAFRLAPRINAAGRLYRADGGVELMLTDDPERAAGIADELNRANSERRTTEREVLAGAELALRELPSEEAEAPALVLAGEGWHPGVVGICASRMVEQTGRPVLLISVDEDGAARGSGRSVPGYDLLAGLRACEKHLDHYGGHRAAAGLELRADSIPALRRAFADHAREALGDEPVAQAEAIDAVVGADELGMSVARELERLGPFGKANPAVRLVVPGARIRDVRPMGEGDRHARFSLEGAGGRARGVAFGVNGSLASASEADALDVSVALELNHWNGSVEPRVVLGQIYEKPVVTGPLTPADLTDVDWLERMLAEAARSPDEPQRAEVDAGRRAVIDRRGRSGTATVAALASTGAPVLVVCSDASRRRQLVERAAAPTRFGGGAVVVAPGAAPDATAEDLGGVLERGGVVLADWPRLEREPWIAPRFGHLVVIDPPAEPGLEALADRGEGGFLHLAWGPAEVEFALRAWEAQWPARPALAAAYRRLREAADERGAISADGVRLALGGGADHPRSPEVAGRLIRVLREVGLTVGAERDASGAGGALRVVSSKGTDLARSPALAAYRARCEEGRRYLNRRRQPT